MKILMLTLATCFLSQAVLAGGTVEDLQFHSAALDEDRWVQVYLPEGYDAGGDERYPAVYFLHGAGDDHTSYPEIIEVLDSLIANGLIDPLVMIKPNGDGCPYGFFTGCGWVNSETQGDFEDYVVQDVVAWAEANYNVLPDGSMRAIMGHSNVLPDGSMRAIMGHSMGGFGAMHAALRHPDVFSAVASHSTYLYFHDFETLWVPAVIAEQPGPPPYTWDPWTGLFTGGFFVFSGCFSPNPLNPPYYLDYPLDEYGDTISSVWERWHEHDPAVLAESLAQGAEPDIYFDCGTQDDFLFYQFNVDFDAHLTALGIAHDWRSYVGDHVNKLRRRFAKSLEFVDSVRMNPTSVEEVAGQSTTLMLRACGPNPSRGPTEIRYSLPVSGYVTLTIHDVAGRLVATVLDAFVPAGSRSALWDGRDALGSEAASGVYFARVQRDGGVLTRKITLIQ